MARKDRTEKMIEHVKEIGIENIAILPKVQNWCSHLVLKAESNGMVAQMYNLPNWFSISCPHSTAGSSAMQLGWIAQSFITESCINCPHYNEVLEDNYGRLVLQKLAEAEAQASQEAAQKNNALQALKERIAEILKTEKLTAATSELSILTLLDKLEASEEKQSNAQLVLEASKLEPSFFTPLSLEILCLYFEDDQIGAICLHVTSNILNHTHEKPKIIIDSAISCLSASLHFDEIALLLKLYINKDNIQQYEPTIEILLVHLRYLRMIGEPGDFQPEYKNSIAFFSNLIDIDKTYFSSLVKRQLSNPDIPSKYNINGLLQELIPCNEPFVRNLLPDIILSLQQDNDDGYESADKSILKTIYLILKSSPSQTMKVIKEIEPKLHSSARISLIPLTRRVLGDEIFSKNNRELVEEMVSDFTNTAISKSTPAELKKEMLDNIREMSGNHTIFFEPHFDKILGQLTVLLEEFQQFQFWKQELENKELGELHTFNPLAGMDYWSVSSQDNLHQGNITSIKDAIGHIIRLNEQKYFLHLQPILRNLDSKTQLALKRELISILTSSLKDPFVITGFIPDLYNYLLDPDSLEVRNEALKMLDRMITKYPAIVPQTLFDLIEAFISDPEIIIHKRAIELIGSVAKYVPDQLQDIHISYAVESLNNNYVAIHKAAVIICEEIYPFASEKERIKIITALYAWEATYYPKKEYDFCATLTHKLIRLSKDHQQRHSFLIKDLVLKYCRTDDYYFSKKFLKTLTEVKTEFPEFQKDWLGLTLETLGKTHSEIGDMEERKEKLSEMYSVSFETINNEQAKLEEFLKKRSSEDGYDIISILLLLMNFEFFETAQKLAKQLLSEIEEVKSNESLRHFLSVILNYASYQVSLTQIRPDISFLKKVADAFTEN